jgi:UDP-glucose 4-epimerase
MSAFDRVLVTGASGYIGQHLVRQLSREGLSEIRGFSHRLRPIIPGLSEWYAGDITNLTDVREAVQGCDLVVHLACMPLGQSQQDPAAAFKVNATGTLNVLQATYELGNVKIIYTSTAQVYGQSKRLPLPEDDPTRPSSPYAASKLCGEIACQSFAYSFGLPVTVLRIFNVYGLAVDGSARPTVETIFLKRILEGQAPIVRGNPNEGRDFIHVDDVVRCIRMAMDGKAMGEVINVGTGVLTTLSNLAWKLIELIRSSLEPVVQPNGKSLTQIQADTTKAEQILGFHAQISLEDGLAQMVNEVTLA